MQSVPSNTATC